MPTVWRAGILGVFVMMTFPPFFDAMGTGLDASWAIGLNEVSSRHMIHGRDTAFTYGPLGFVITPRDLGSNLIHATLFRLGLHVLWWTSVGTLLFRIRGYVATVLFAAASVLSGIYFGPKWDVNFQLTGVINLTAAGYLVLGHIDRRPIWAVPAAIVSAAALLAKFNIGIACAGSIVVWAVIQLLRDRSLHMLGRLGLAALTYVGVLVMLFRIHGGPLDALDEFLMYSHQIAAGYSSQMAKSGPAAELVVLAGVMAIAVFAAAAGIMLRARYAPVLLIILFPLFVLFKSAIVRHDPSHVLPSLPPIVGLAALLLPGCIGRCESWMTQAVVAVALFVVSWIAPTSATNLLTRGVASWAQLRNYSEVRADRRAMDYRANDQLRLPSPIRSRIGPATVDVYPWDICSAIANGLNWKPRFVFQSYSAYCPTLDRKCAENYRGKNAPRYVLYSHQAIDTQHPCIVDPRTWLEMYRSYDPVDQVQSTLLLERRTSPRWEKVEWLGSTSLAFGDRWVVPEGGQGPVILQAKLRLSSLGRLISMAYKINPPTIRVEYQDGSVNEHSLVWRNVASGFLVSSLPRDSNGVRSSWRTASPTRFAPSRSAPTMGASKSSSR